VLWECDWSVADHERVTEYGSIEKGGAS
jgi:hypothetical protein